MTESRIDESAFPLPPGEWILLVDDDVGICELAAKVLRRKGYETRSAASGSEALSLVREGSPAVMIIDYRLPDMTGQDLVIALEVRGLKAPFVMMTGQGDERLAVEIMKQGASDYLIKDTELMDRIPAAVGRILKAAELNRRLAMAEDKLRLAANVYTHSREGILITDASACIIDVNPAFTEITGYSREEVLGENPRILNSGRQSREFYADLWENLLAVGHWNGEVWNRRKDGALYAELLNISSVRDERGEVRNYIAQFSDITTLKEYQGQLERIAHFDSLTGLPNRLLLADRMMQAMAQVPRREMCLAIAYLDLDGFKTINDTHGHEMGDRLLAALSSRMLKSLRDGDTLARLGGDEFVAVLVDLPDAESAGVIVSRLLEAVSQSIALDGAVLQVSASLGVSMYPQRDEVDADQLLRQADQAMYQAKQSGKNRYHIFDSEQDRNVRGRYEGLKRIERALENGEFVLYYQPKVNMRTAELVGAEALIRWNHPEEGLLPPSAFLPLIENHPLSIKVGEWVLETALSQMDRWRVLGHDIPVSVNVSALQLQHPDFPARLRALLEGHPGLRAGSLELEILETSALEDVGIVSGLMSRCAEIGVGFALDDFGTGYSSLLYLKQLPARLIKIDQSFIRDLLDTPGDLAILEGVVGLASAFRRSLIAEGVETVAHGEILLCMGCELAQGYAIARPMPAEDFLQWAESWDSPPVWKALGPLRRDALPTLYAAVAHRAWVLSLEKYLAGERESPPELKRETCPFCAWYRERGKELLSGDRGEPSVDVLHRELHRLASDMVAHKAKGDSGALREGIIEARRLGDSVFARLEESYRDAPSSISR